MLSFKNAGVIMLSEGWVQTAERIVEQIRKLSEKKDKDRLDFVQSLRFSLYALHRSLLGWMSWINKPDIMTSFNKEELDGMNKKIIEFVEEFIEYDVDVTKQGAKKTGAALESRREAEERARRGPEEVFYI